MINFKQSRLIIILIFSFLGLSIIPLRLPFIKFRGFLSDEATYLSIAQSLIYDKDIIYEQKDLIRITEKYPSGPQGIFLKRGLEKDKLYYAKSLIYPLLASPFYALLRERGLLLFNVLLAFLSLYVANIWLVKKLNDCSKALVWTLIFFFFSIAIAYLIWMTPEIFNFSTVLIGLCFWTYKYLKENNISELNQSYLHKLMMNPKSSIIASLLFALAACSKPPNFILIIPFGIMLILEKKWKDLFLAALVYILIFGLFFSSYYLLTGDWNFMGGERKTFYGILPLDNPSATFDNLGVSHTAENYWENYYITPKIFFFNLLYFFVGRFSGIFLYFVPSFFILIYFFIKEKNKLSYIAFLLIFIQIIGYIGLIPHNYYGGGGTLGNRYFMNIYPLFFILIPESISLKMAIANFLASALLIGQIMINLFYSSFFPSTHTKSFPFKYFPPEMTMIENLSTNVNPHAFHIPFGNPPKYYLYFLNDNFYSPEKGGFWIPGKSQLEFIMEVHYLPKKILFQLENGLSNNNHIKIKLGNEFKDIEMISGQSRIIEFNAKEGFWYTRNKFFYRIKISSEKGYIPAYWGGNRKDRRFLGCFLKIDVSN